MNQNILSTLAETWQMLTIIGVALSVGYATARKFEGLLGKNKKGDTVVERLEKIERQIMPNGGSSMSDKIDYIRRDQNRMKQQVSEISGELKVIKDIVTVIVDK
jgi:cytochrome c biogenesis factor